MLPLSARLASLAPSILRSVGKLGISLYQCASVVKQIYSRFVGTCIPEQLQDNPLAFSRAKNVLNAATIAAIAIPFYAAFYHHLGFTASTPVFLLYGAFMMSTPLILRITGRVKIAEEVLAGSTYYFLCWLTYHMGGLDAPSASWLIICPIVAILLNGLRSGFFWLGMTCIAVISFYFLQLSGFQFPKNPVQDVLLLQVLSQVGLLLIVIIFSWLFDRSKVEGFTKLQQAIKTIEELAIRDDLTGIANRRQLLKMIESEKDRASRSRSPFCICLIDIDHFKRINDTFGHSAGDAVLKTFAEMVEANIRQIDCFGRYGGEEFLLMLPQTNLNQALLLAERVRAETERMSIKYLPRMPKVTVSMGIAQFEPGESITLTINRADQALYKAKKKGRNRILLADSFSNAEPDTATTLTASSDVAALSLMNRHRKSNTPIHLQGHHRSAIQNTARTLHPTGSGTASIEKQICPPDQSLDSSDQLAWQHELKFALDRNQLFVQYQPQVDILTREIIGVEALVRWHHPQLGIISPAKFIPYAEESGLILAIGEWVFRTACLQQKQWLKAGLAPIKIAVNLSPCQLRDPNIVPKITSIIEDEGIDPTLIELEITEGLLIEDFASSKKIIAQLRGRGIKIAIDDFGTGYSSLNYLSELPLDILKMDGSFVKRIGSNDSEESTYLIPNAIIAMAHSLKLTVVAEAVETEQQLACLGRMKCDQAQGFLFSRPIQACEIENMLQEQMQKKVLATESHEGEKRLVYCQ